jgi:hypothetical protein
MFEWRQVKIQSTPQGWWICSVVLFSAIYVKFSTTAVLLVQHQCLCKVLCWSVNVCKFYGVKLRMLPRVSECITLHRVIAIFLAAVWLHKTSWQRN